MDSLTSFNQFTSRQESLIEAWGDLVPMSDWDVAGSAAGISNLQRVATTLYDRADGRYLPVYQTEFDLAVIRATGRTLAELSSSLIGGIRNLSNYTIGEGFTFKATREEACGVDDQSASNLLQMVQREIDYLLDDNDFTSSFDHELHRLSIIDGEDLCHLKFRPDGRVRIHRREPDELRQPYRTRELEDWIESVYDIPCSEFVPSWSFGVLTRLDQPDEPLGYHLVSDEAGVNWEFVPANRMVHIKRNVPRNAKRGFSDLYPVEGDATRGYKLLRNMTEGGASRASIIYVREWVAGTQRGTVESSLGDKQVGTSKQSLSSGGNRSVSTGDYRRPHIRDVSAGMQMKPPPTSEETEDLLMLAKEVQRQQAVRWAMPEYMFTGDASNANYSSTMEATAPFVKSCETEQRFYSRQFVSLIWKALRMRSEAGAFGDIPFEEIERIVKIRAECPTVATRDPLKVREALKMEMEMGITSPDTAATECGRDLQAEQDKGARSVVGDAAAETPQGTEQAAIDPNAAAVADTAFNGAQVTSMVDLITQVSAGTLPAESAIQAMLIAFPAITDQQARALIDPAQKMAANLGTVPTATGGGELLGKNLQQVRRIDKLRQGYIDAFKAGEIDRAAAELALDGLGYNKEKIALYLDGNPANDPIEEPPSLPESLAESIIPEPVSETIKRWENYP